MKLDINVNGEKYGVDDDRYHVRIARDVLKRWLSGERVSIVETPDRIITEQLIHFTTEQPFNILTAEHIPYSVMMGLISLEDAIIRFPTLKYHENDRTKEILHAKKQVLNWEVVSTTDHRIIMACAYYAKKNHITVKFAHPEQINKSDPLFFKRLNEI